MPLIDVGAKAPVFKLADSLGEVHHLKDYLGRPVVLCFYPKDDTPTCADQACALRDAMPRFESTTAAVLGVSPDGPESHERFARKFRIPFPLLCDVASRDGVPRIADRYGAWRMKSMYGREYMGVVRTTYLIDEGGRVARRWDNVRVAGHVDEVLDAVHALRRGAPMMASMTNR
ncbi:MAG: peroxiredoxin [Phycisphaerales bacterium]